MIKLSLVAAASIIAESPYFWGTPMVAPESLWDSSPRLAPLKHQ